MSVKIILPPLMSGFCAVSKAIGAELWISLGKTDKDCVLKLAQRGNQDAQLLVAIDCVNKGDADAGLKIIQELADDGHGSALELLAATEFDGELDVADQQKIFTVLLLLGEASNHGRPWSMITWIALHEMGFFKDFPGLISDKHVFGKLINTYCAHDNEICADIACALHERGFKDCAYAWAKRSIKRGEIGAWQIHVDDAAVHGDAKAYKNRLYEGAEWGNPSCSFRVAKAIWDELLFLQGQQEKKFHNSARDMARIAAQEGDVKALILYGMMCEQGFGGEIEKVEAIGALMVAHALEPSPELAGLIYRISSKTPATLGIDVALDWMMHGLDYKSSFRSFAVTGYLKDTFTNVWQSGSTPISISVGRSIIFLKTKGTS